MKTRIITAAVAIIIAAMIFVFGEMHTAVITVAIAILSAIMCGEYLAAKKLHKNMTIFLPCIVFGAMIPALPYFDLGFSSNAHVGFMPYYLFVLYLCAIAVLCHDTIPIEDILYTFFGMSLITVSMALFTLRVCADNRHPTFWALLIYGVPAIADTAAYFIGSAIGKHKLCPNISPKKTIEGAVGGVLIAALSPLLFGLIFYYAYGNIKVNWVVLPIIGLVNALISILGDLLFSVIKRKCGVKDYGSIMPGHGGMLDRFDSLILCVPFVYFLAKYVPIITDIPVA